jgi:hypothetical protein
MYFSQHINRGKCFALFEFNMRCVVQNIQYVEKKFIKYKISRNI